MNLGTGIIGGAKPASILYVDNGMSASNPATSYTFAGRNLGPEHPKRTLVVMLGWSPLTSGTFGSCRIDGNNMNFHSLGATDPRLYTLPWPTGETGTIQTTIASGNFMFCYFIMWAAYNLKDEAPTDTFYDIPSISDPYFGNVDVKPGGVAVGYASRVGGSGFAWTGITEDLNRLGGISNAYRISGASAAFKLAQTPLNVSTTTGTIHRHALAAFR